MRFFKNINFLIRAFKDVADTGQDRKIILRRHYLIPIESLAICFSLNSNIDKERQVQRVLCNYEHDKENLEAKPHTIQPKFQLQNCWEMIQK